MRRILTILALLAFLGMAGTDAIAGCKCCKPPSLEKMTAPKHQCCLYCCCCCKKQETVGESYMGKGNGIPVGPCCEQPAEHHHLALLHKHSK